MLMAIRIHILPEQLTNKIAAGEVVERPASVVKELLENALDAGSSDIRVDIEQGGRRLIKVTDNGCGMTREDALLALERHATSKISVDADLFTLETLGFRGEAIPSIASVSRFKLATREHSHLEGTEIYAEGGIIKEVKACGMAAGTVVEVRNLFFNTPARLKFMKSRETEEGHVGDLLTRLAISRPEIRFTYLSDNRTIFRVLNDNLRNRVSALLGASLASEMMPLQVENNGVRLHGLISRPQCNRSAATHLYTYVNGRFIRDKVVQHAVLQAYRNVLERGRYPVVVLFIDLPPGDLDVNVHPTKHEVRFREQGAVHDSICHAIAGVLADTTGPKGSSIFVTPQSSSVNSAAARVAEVRETLANYRPSPERQHEFATVAPQVRLNESPALPQRLTQENSTAPSGFFSRMVVLGQYNAEYLLCQSDNDLVIIDQHAAHERVVFERLKFQYLAEGIEGQGLLFPDTADMSFTEAAALREHAAALHQLGFTLEHFGGSTWLVKEVPRILAAGDYIRILRDLLGDLSTLGKSSAISEKLDDLLARIACHSVVRGQYPLEQAEVKALFARMDQIDYAGNCPHGRPVYRTITRGEIEKMFKRG
jgi:DNA mismatch repair protein MutL